MRDPAGPPVWLIVMVALLWAFAVGVWRERNRPGGSKDQVADLEARNDELLATVDELVATNARSRIEIVTRRNAAMPHLVSSACDDQRDLHVIQGGRRLTRALIGSDWPVIAPPVQPDVELYTAEIGEVVKASATGHCHHRTSCIAPLRVGELVVPVGPFYALLDHIERDNRAVL